MGLPAAKVLEGEERREAIETIRANHYTQSVPSGKSIYIEYGSALVVWAIPANKNIAKFVLGWNGSVWELARLWAPDGHDRNLLTQAISAAIKILRALEAPDAVVSYADPNVGHAGGVYKAASWTYFGTSEEVRAYRRGDGPLVSRRAFHSGRKSLRKSEIQAMGYSELRLRGKIRFVRALTRKASRAIRQRENT